MNNKYTANRDYPPYRVFWNWELTHDCNYKCSYCPTWRDDVDTPRYLKVSEWKDIWDRLFELYYSGVVRFSGGEPSAYPGFEEIVGAVAEKHSIDITTNLSFDVKKFADSVEPGNVAISASFHPEYNDIKDFLERLLFLHNKGYISTICFVCYPPHLPDLHYYKSLVEENGIMFKFIPFNGSYKGKQYPKDYTDEEQKLMEDKASDAPDDKANEINSTWYEWNAQKRDSDDGIRIGKICRMGQMYAKIETDGTVKRCCADDTQVLGSIFDENFKLLSEAAECSTVHCPCFKAMVVGNENKWSSIWEGLPHKKYT